MIHPELKKIFGPYDLYQHQVEAIKLGVKDKSIVVTSGTGSGKSLIFLATIFNHILNNKKEKGTKAILVYPMNALSNSQEEEIKKYEINFLKSFLQSETKIDLKDKSLDETIDLLKSYTKQEFPITYAKYTGQEKMEARQQVEEDLPDLLLTNYMMLELMMTRNTEYTIRESIKDNLRFLVFDELHTYRGRQGSDVAMLIRRISSQTKHPLVFIGTSATMSSGGTLTDQKQAVAEFTSKIFGQPIDNEQVIGETLATCTDFNGTLPTKEGLSRILQDPINVEQNEAHFICHPLAIWLENKIALLHHTDGFTERNKPQTLSEIINQLSEDSGLGAEICTVRMKELLKWTENLNVFAVNNNTRKSYLPYKLHQFISQTGSVFVTLEPKDIRLISLDAGRYTIKDGAEKPVFPVLFSRYSGHEFICVTKDFENNRLLPREPYEIPPRITLTELRGDPEVEIERRVLDKKDFPAGYIIIPNENEEIWSDNDLDNLPDNWFRTIAGNRILDNLHEYQIPNKIYFNSDGDFSKEPGYELWGWFMPAPLLLDPTAGIVFDINTKDSTKLMRLGNEGRSTATTISTFNILRALHNNQVPLKEQKLLSFSDNRQDTALQSGHFNDFIQIGRLRSAIYHALKSAPDQSLTIDMIANKVFQVLGLLEEEYAQYPSADPEWRDEENDKALKDYLLIRILYDLKRGWRYNTPNLEQCGLLEIQYKRLDEFASKESFWQNIPFFNSISPEERYSILLNILNYFRTHYAIDYYKLSRTQISELESQLKNKLAPEKLWSLDYNEKIENPTYLIIRSIGRTPPNVFVAKGGMRSNLGKYLRRIFKENQMEVPRGEEYLQLVESLLDTLLIGNFLMKEKIRGDRGEAMGYRLRLDQVLWKLGSGDSVMLDEVRIASYRDIKIKPNPFFKDFYIQDFKSFNKPFYSREHSGQINDYSERIKREDEFRQGKISALYCSPTMELGIDISTLNVVHMRNVPPSPANYVQRSGRAGRSGQAALIFNYCSQGSPHDRNYFQNKLQMVSGTVVAPKIDLTNEELIAAHLNAFILMELRLNSLHTSVAEILDLQDKENLSIKPEIQNYIQNQLPVIKPGVIAGFTKMLASMYGDLLNSYWYSDNWIEKQVEDFYKNFNGCFDRWRKLFKSAIKQIEQARIILDDVTIQPGNYKKFEAERIERISRNMRDILLNTSNNRSNNESEFYVFRYLAAEGFLPGYNFTRLPIRTFAGSRDKGEFISRSRFIALREFGPRNMVYHNGAKYRIDRMIITQADASLHQAKISVPTGYVFLDAEGTGINNDPITDIPLNSESNLEVINTLLEMAETEARPVERISCEEEERMSRGFDIEQYFSVPKGMESTKKVTLFSGEFDLLHIIYAPAARLVQMNRRWKVAKEGYGFVIGNITGRWKQKRELENPDQADPAIKVQLYTHDTVNLLYIQPVKTLKLDESGVVTLSYALKRAIEKIFQVEESEVGVWIMGKKTESNILIYEAAEGSLGVLSQMVENTSLMKRVFEEAYQVCHFDLESQTDTRPDEPKASYNNLLSYYNQRHHDLIDRHAIKEALELLMTCKANQTTYFRSLDEHYQYLIKNYDLNSATEKPFIDYLYKNGIRLPDKAQVNIPGYYINADFVYMKNQTEAEALIFCDGGVHDRTEVHEDDLHKRRLLRDGGYDVIEWRYDETLDSLIHRRKDIFRKLR
ncbi:MAG TPA: DEAD/DEAH box helicase [Bacteroidales bacterium]|nr:DEAD/DEAH box helicase [Bacteroidales bacterium]